MVHVLFSVAAFVFALSVGLTVLIKDQTKKVNKFFFYFSFLLSVMFFSDVFVQISDTVSGAYSWAIVYSVILIFLPALFLHLTTIFPKQRQIFVFKPQNGLSESSYENTFSFNLKYLMYLPSLFFLFFMTSFVKGFYYTESFNISYGFSQKIFAVYFLIYTYFGIRNMVLSLKEPDTDIRKMQSAYAVIGILMFIVFVGLTEIILPAFNFYTYRLSSIFALVMYSFISYSIHRHYLFVREPLAEECSAKEFQRFPLQPKASIMIKDRPLHDSFHIFLDQILHGKSGLCITRTNPKKVLEEYPLKRTPILWITELNVKDALHPGNIEEIGYAIERFIGTSDNSVVYIDGIEYLSAYNSFNKTLHLIQDLKDKISMVNSNLLIPIQSNAFERSQLKILERELDEM